MADKDTTGTTGGGSDEDVADLGALLGETPGGADAAKEPEGKPKTREELAARLRILAESFGKTQTFKVGQLVRWKKNMKNRRNPEYGNPIVVTQVLDHPVHDQDQKNGAGSPYFREPLTIVAGRMDNEGNLVCYHYDGRRLEPFGG